MYSYCVKERLLSVENLYLNLNGIPILRDVNFAVNDIIRPDVTQGQVISLLGLSGSGKTQLFRCLAGLQAPTKGHVLLNEVRTPVTPGEVGVVFQNYPLFKSRTVWDNLQLANHSHQHDDVIIKYLDRFQLLNKKDLYPNQLSGGQRQRVAICQQLLCSTHYFLMDEPFSGLDFKMKQEACKLIIDLSQTHEANTIIITTHDIQAALSISDTILILGTQKFNGVPVPGSTIVKKFDLAALGIAWRPDVKSYPQYQEVLKDIYEIFEQF